MHEASLVPTGPYAKPARYKQLLAAAQSLLGSERDLIANAANVAALLYHGLPDLNWLGFYFLRGGELLVGPFQGKPACVRIALGKGVCGAAAARRETIVVPDVNEFPGHIACEASSRSEIVVPIVSGTELLGVLDADSPLAGRFDDVDRGGFESMVRIFAAACEWR